MTPQLFVYVALGSGLEKIINENIEAPYIFFNNLSKEIYLPIVAFIILINVGIF